MLFGFILVGGMGHSMCVEEDAGCEFTKKYQNPVYPSYNRRHAPPKGSDSRENGILGF